MQWPESWIPVDFNVPPNQCCVLRVHAPGEGAAGMPYTTRTFEREMTTAQARPTGNQQATAICNFIHMAVRELIGDVRQLAGIARGHDATNPVNATRAFHALTAYEATADEDALANAAHQALTAQPSTLDGTQREPLLARSVARSSRTADRSERYDSRAREYRVSDSLWYQLQSLSGTPLTEWPSSSNLYKWMSNIVFCMRHGTVSASLDNLLSRGARQVLHALRVVISGCITRRHPSISDIWNTSQSQQQIQKIEYGAAERIQPCLTRSVAYEAAGRIADAMAENEAARSHFYLGLSRLLATLRSLIYGRELTDQVHYELRMLCDVKRTRGLTDSLYWSDICRTARSWQLLLGDDLWNEAATELRPFLTNAARQLEDRASGNVLIDESNKFLLALSKNLNLQAPSELPGISQQNLRRAREFHFPDARGAIPRDSNMRAKVVKMFDELVTSVEDLGLVIMVGAAMLPPESSSCGRPHLAGALLMSFLESSTHRMGTHEVSTLSANGEIIDAAVLAVREKHSTAYATGHGDGVFLENDMMGSSRAFPDGEQSMPRPSEHGLFMLPATLTTPAEPSAAHGASLVAAHGASHTTSAPGQSECPRHGVATSAIADAASERDMPTSAAAAPTRHVSFEDSPQWTPTATFRARPAPGSLGHAYTDDKALWQSAGTSGNGAGTPGNDTGDASAASGADDDRPRTHAATVHAPTEPTVYEERLRKLWLADMQAAQASDRTERAMHSELTRHQIDNLAGEDMRHARNVPLPPHNASLGGPSPQQLQVADNTRNEPTPLSADAVRRDARRSNLGGRGGALRGGAGRGYGQGPGIRQSVSGRQPPPRSNGQFKRMDKPGTLYKDVSADGRAVLRDEYAIGDDAAYNLAKEQPCVICKKQGRPVDHMLNRCLGIWGTTPHCTDTIGADAAARKRRDFLGINALHEIRDSYDDASVPHCDRLVLEQHLDCIFESSPTLMNLDVMYECADELDDGMLALALAEFDRAQRQYSNDVRLLS